MATGKKAIIKIALASTALVLTTMSTAAKCGDDTICHPPPGADNACPNQTGKPNTTPSGPKPSVSIVIKK